MFNALIPKKPDKEKDDDSLRFDQLIGNTYKVGKKIGSGAFGQIRVGTDVRTGQTTAIKFESVFCSDPQLKMENHIYQLLQGHKGFPKIFFFGRYMDHYVLVMEMLGRNLDSVFEFCKYKFTLKSTIFLALQLLKRFETIHECKVVYRDVKPENFMLGPKTNTVYVVDRIELVDYGLSKQYIDSDNRHITFNSTHEIIGTTRYMSINAHLGMELSRRDDLEALGYVFLYFLREGKLPWSGLKAESSKEHNKMICDLKRKIPEEEMFRGFPDEFRSYLKQVRSLKFDEQPNYASLRESFKLLFREEQFKNDGIYDWNC